MVVMEEDHPNTTDSDFVDNAIVTNPQEEKSPQNIPSTNLDTSYHSVEDKDSRDEFFDSLIDTELNDSAVLDQKNSNDAEEMLIEDNSVIPHNVNGVRADDVNDSCELNESETSVTDINATDTDIIDGDEAEELPDSIPNDSKFTKPKDILCHFPLGRIKRIVKADSEVSVISAESLFLISKATELFLRWLGKEVHAYTIQQKKKTMQVRDLNLAISEHPALEFLDGALD